MGDAFGAGSAAVGLYVAHNVFYAAFAFVAGWFADRVNKARLLATGYGLAAAMALGIIVLPLGLWTLAVVFVVARVIYLLCYWADLAWQRSLVWCIGLVCSLLLMLSPTFRSVLL